VFKYPVKYKKNFQILIIFIEIQVTVWHLFDHALMLSIIFHTRRPINKDNVSYVLEFYVSSDVHFGTFRSWKHVLHMTPFRSTCYELTFFGCLNVSNSVWNWNKVENLIFVWSILQICHLEIPVFIYKLMYDYSLWIRFIWVLWI